MATTTSPTAASTVPTSSAAATSSAATASAPSGNQIAGNFQDFLLLLTTQLKNQSPLDPLDTNQFTQQLVQFAGVEQQLRGNDTLSSILTATKSATTANAASYVGLTVTSDGTTGTLSNGSASWTVNPAKAVAKSTVTIKDKDDKAIVTKPATFTSGSQTYTWDGKDAAGNLQPDGDYTISFSAFDAAGQSVPVSTEVSGKVTAVNVAGSSPILTVGTNSIPLSRVRTIAYQ